jgi:hypothetical protein
MLKISQNFFKKFYGEGKQSIFLESFGNIPLVGMESSK